MNSVLIADDDFISLEVLKAMLSSYECQIVTAGDGEEALEKAQSCTPSLIILDYEMPKLNGAEVCEKLRTQEAFIHTPIIALTGHQSSNELNACREAGMNHTLHKPVSPDALDEVMQQYL
ncbi:MULTISPECIES: response regulator [Gammaproteobacteria]|uniref:response regulator n=1 Tax=Gammaproteobacteria TaxID=1236 RepID=UPI000DD03EB7|nr:MULTISPECIES: response regulator [Gammaproteobacteria]RTE87545.1 response regulator [Aliidiomarina sp. B3213]TCZ92670.1 response regulator [Lysobacter sp. N42]